MLPVFSFQYWINQSNFYFLLKGFLNHSTVITHIVWYGRYRENSATMCLRYSSLYSWIKCNPASLHTCVMSFYPTWSYRVVHLWLLQQYCTIWSCWQSPQLCQFNVRRRAGGIPHFELIRVLLEVIIGPESDQAQLVSRIPTGIQLPWVQCTSNHSTWWKLHSIVFPAKLELYDFPVCTIVSL